jgi:hypothetical protein
MNERQVINRNAFEAMLKSLPPGIAIAPLDGWYQMPRVSPKSQTWYFAAQCQKCHRATPIFEDASMGKSERKFTGSGGIIVECHHCQAQIRAVASSIRPYQWP